MFLKLAARRIPKSKRDGPAEWLSRASSKLMDSHQAPSRTSCARTPSSSYSTPCPGYWRRSSLHYSNCVCVWRHPMRPLLLAEAKCLVQFSGTMWSPYIRDHPHHVTQQWGTSQLRRIIIRPSFTSHHRYHAPQNWIARQNSSTTCLTWETRLLPSLCCPYGTTATSFAQWIGSFTTHNVPTNCNNDKDTPKFRTPHIETPLLNSIVWARMTMSFCSFLNALSCITHQVSTFFDDNSDHPRHQLELVSGTTCGCLTHTSGHRHSRATLTLSVWMNPSSVQA